MQKFTESQTLDTWLRANSRELQNNGATYFYNANAGILNLKCPDGSEYTITREDFPNRNLIACYKSENGKTVFSHYEQECTPALSFCDVKEGITA